MEQIIVQVQDRGKAEILLELLAALDFVNSVKISQQENIDHKATTPEEPLDFFSMAGLWANREISSASIRQKAWPRQHYDIM